MNTRRIQPELFLIVTAPVSFTSKQPLLPLHARMVWRIQTGCVDARERDSSAQADRTMSNEEDEKTKGIETLRTWEWHQVKRFDSLCQTLGIRVDKR